MMKYFKNTKDGYILSISENYGESEISIKEFNRYKTLIENAPIAESGYAYVLNSDYTWIKIELDEEIHYEDDEAEISDYENALSDLGVTVDEEEET